MTREKSWANGELGIDVAFDVALVLLDLTASPVMLPARVVRFVCVRMLKMACIRHGRKTVKRALLVTS